MELEQELIQWRHDLHAHPEFGLEEKRTSAIVAQKLEEFGLEVHRNIGKTGVVGILRNGTSNKSIGLRADMDALLIQEENTFSYASKNKGKMHACGHDGHTTMLLGAAKELAKNPDFDGTVYFIFQPDEERGLGAKTMIKDGLFKKWSIDAVFAMHNMPGIKAGTFITRPSSIMASESGFEIEIIATGGHAALPHMGTDPLVVGAQIVTALQSLITRNLNSIQEVAVLSVTEFVTNGTVNVIPSKVTLKGDTRSFTDKALHKIKEGIERIVTGHCLAAGVEYKYHFNNGFLSTINTPKETEIAIQAATKVVGVDSVNGNCDPLTISEDFSFMLRERPGCYILVGNGDGESNSIPLHNPQYDFNDAILITGVNFWQELVKTYL